MKLRFILTLLVAPACLFAHELLVVLYEHVEMPFKRNMLSFGIGIDLAGWALVLLFPITSWLGDLWCNDRRRYVINVLLLIALTAFIATNWSTHPYRTLLFLGCCWSTLPLRWLIDRMTMAR
jgi:hypothetical protein